MLKQKTLLVGLGILAVAVAVTVGLNIFQPQQPISVAPPISVTPKKIGVIQWGKALDSSFEGFKKGMADLGYVEGKDVVYDHQISNADITKLNEIAKNFVDQDVDLIFAIAFPSAKAALKATTDAGKSHIPVVFAHASNPLEGGLIKSYKSSGNNLTGVAADIAGLTPKKLEILKRINPNIKKVGFFSPKDDKIPSFVLTVAALKENAPKFGITLVEYSIKNQVGPEFVAEVQQVADSIKPGDVDAMFHPPGVIDSKETLAIDAALGRRLRIPVTFVTPQMLDIGGLFVYAHSFYAAGEQAAPFADKILKGAKPSDIPIEFLSKNVLMVSMKNAQEIGVTIPQDLLEIAEPWKGKD